jgi:hypothetical protein
MKKAIIIICLLSFSSNLITFGQITKIKKTKEEAKVCELIASLPVVVHADNYVRKVTKGKRHLFTYLDSGPTRDDNYYYVKVAEDNGMSYHTHFIFLVDPKTYAIKWLNTVTDERIPLKLCNKKLFDEYSFGK